jgi:hypothetical protein
MKNEVPANGTDANENKAPTDEQLIERLPNDTAVDLEKPENKVADPIPTHINGVEAPWTTPQKRSKKPLLLLLAVIVLLITGVAAWYFLIYLPDQAKDAKQDGASAATKFASTQALLDAVKPDLKGALIATTGESYGLSATDANGFAAYGVASYRVGDSKFNVLPATANGVGYKGDSVVAKGNYESLTKFFEANKFKKVMSLNDASGPVSVGDLGSYVSYAEYESPDLLCAISHADASGTSLKAHVAGVGCASKASYKEAADTLQPFYASYVDKTNDMSNDYVFGFVDYGKGLNGYEYTLLYQQDESKNDGEADGLNGSSIGYYYKTQSEDKWVYYDATEPGTGLLPCVDFKTDISKQAFNGLGCFNLETQKESVVR